MQERVKKIWGASLFLRDVMSRGECENIAGSHKCGSSPVRTPSTWQVKGKATNGEESGLTRGKKAGRHYGSPLSACDPERGGQKDFGVSSWTSMNMG